MSAATAPHPKSGEAKAHEPSMEEILASIRRIIADDQALPLTPRPALNLRSVAAEPSAAAEPPRRAARPQPADDETEFLSKLAVTLPNSRHSSERFAPPEPQLSPVAEAEPAMEEPEIEAPETDLWAASSAEADEPIAEPETSADAPPPQSFDADDEHPPGEALSSFMPSGVSAMPPAVAPRDDQLLSPSTDASVASSFNVLATTMFIQNSGAIEQAVRDMLRPMLQRWLDDNLPTMVERLVRAEIERVARGGRG
jgi:uncharacterized protein